MSTLMLLPILMSGKSNQLDLYTKSKMEWGVLEIAVLVVFALIAAYFVYLTFRTWEWESHIIREIKKNPQSISYGSWTKEDIEGYKDFRVKFVDSHPLSKKGLISVGDRREQIEELMLRNKIMIMREQ